MYPKSDNFRMYVSQTCIISTIIALIVGFGGGLAIGIYILGTNEEYSETWADSSPGNDFASPTEPQSVSEQKKADYLPTTPGLEQQTPSQEEAFLAHMQMVRQFKCKFPIAVALEISSLHDDISLKESPNFLYIPGHTILHR
jgi:hypothetical protein